MMAHPYMHQELARARNADLLAEARRAHLAASVRRERDPELESSHRRRRTLGLALLRRTRTARAIPSAA